MFSMKDLGPLHYFLGMEVTRTTSSFHLSQAKFLKCTNMANCKPIHMPASPGHSLFLHEGEPISDATEFRNVVSALQYLLFTRPNIVFSVNQVCKFMHSPTTVH